MNKAKYLPRGWDSLEDLLEYDAGRSWLVDRACDIEGFEVDFEHPISAEKLEGEGGNWYEIYRDGSLLFVNNSEDEAWCCVYDYCAENFSGLIREDLDELSQKLWDYMKWGEE